MNIRNTINVQSKTNKIPHADLPKKAGVSHEIIGCYKRNEVSSLVEVDKKIALPWKDLWII